MIEGYLEAAAALGDLNLEPRGWFGDLATDDPIRRPTWRECLSARIAKYLSLGPRDRWKLNPAAIADDLPDAERPAFVHLDAFIGNMLASEGRITAVLDVGDSAVCDRRLDPLAAAVCLTSTEISGVTTPRNVDVAMNWLTSAGLNAWFEPARRWLAAFGSSPSTTCYYNCGVIQFCLGP